MFCVHPLFVCYSAFFMVCFVFVLCLRAVCVCVLVRSSVCVTRVLYCMCFAHSSFGYVCSLLICLDVLALCLRCVGTVLALRWRCVGAAWALFGRYVGAVSALQGRCVGTSLPL